MPWQVFKTVWALCSVVLKAAIRNKFGLYEMQKFGFINSFDTTKFLLWSLPPPSSSLPTVSLETRNPYMKCSFTSRWTKRGNVAGRCFVVENHGSRAALYFILKKIFFLKFLLTFKLPVKHIYFFVDCFLNEIVLWK